MDLNARARDILRANDRGGYTIPTEGLYPYQWNWDSAFTALGLATFDPERAWQEISMLMEAQWPDGMIPHIIFRVDAPSYFPGPSVWGGENGPIPSSGISQPPVLASVVHAISRQDPRAAAPYLDGLEAWHQWWHRARDPSGSGTIAITHPWESGRDNQPCWDAPGAAIDTSGVGDYTRRDTALVDAEMRPKKADYDRYLALVQFGRARGWDTDLVAAECPFFVADPGMSAILLRAERDLAEMQAENGAGRASTEARIARLSAGMAQLWNPKAGAYVAKDMRTGTLSEHATCASFLPLYAGVTERKSELIETLGAMAQEARYMVPSFDPRAPLFDHIRYWRGPVWAMINFMIAQGLKETGESEWAERVRSDTAALIRASGFAEYFSPIDAQGCGGGTFSWTAAIWLAWDLENAKG